CALGLALRERTRVRSNTQVRFHPDADAHAKQQSGSNEHCPDRPPTNRSPQLALLSYLVPHLFAWHDVGRSIVVRAEPRDKRIERRVFRIAHHWLRTVGRLLIANVSVVTH